MYNSFPVFVADIRILKLKPMVHVRYATATGCMSCKVNGRKTSGEWTSFSPQFIPRRFEEALNTGGQIIKGSFGWMVWVATVLIDIISVIEDNLLDPMIRNEGKGESFPHYDNNHKV